MGSKALFELRLEGEVQRQFPGKNRSSSHSGSAQPACLAAQVPGTLWPHLFRTRNGEAQAQSEQPHLHHVVELHLPLSRLVGFKVLHLVPLCGLRQLPCVWFGSGGLLVPEAASFLLHRFPSSQ